jgi:hypothetical protein
MIVNRDGKSILCTRDPSLSLFESKLVASFQQDSGGIPLCQFNSTSAVKIRSEWQYAATTLLLVFVAACFPALLG